MCECEIVPWKVKTFLIIHGKQFKRSNYFCNTKTKNSLEFKVTKRVWCRGSRLFHSYHHSPFLPANWASNFYNHKFYFSGRIWLLLSLDLNPGVFKSKLQGLRKWVAQTKHKNFLKLKSWMLLKIAVYVKIHLIIN